MSQSTAESVETAAKQADYKAMLNTRKNVQKDPAFALATESQKSAMFKMAMRETMERRRSRGQDTVSKMAAFRAGQYRGSGFQTLVPIADFLRNKGWVPSDPTGAQQRDAALGGSSSLRGAPVAGMEGGDSPLADAYGMPSAPGRHGFVAHGYPTSVPLRRDQRDVNPVEGHHLSSPARPSIKPAPEAFASMSPEPMLATIEGDVSANDIGDSMTRLQTEMGYLRTICDNVASNNAHVRDEFGRIEAEMGLEKGRVDNQEARMTRLENVVHALQNTSLSAIVDKMNELENAVEELKAKVGGGCDAEIANMREVMGGLKNLLDRVGGFA
ncbi:hypothetical protein KVR01_009279 [Diaporthe batatas]|uniref:uncharacterized protein n=1 Tax=Diaporthe batatas TaxID=748121 RepID=UPI001D04A874|nr:uncharacterized protein KVR01_009279 [Diaporthe batatas]KAG8161015.1 hypothetical protein KVR01_009279 [Diaporthe batatas]